MIEFVKLILANTNNLIKSLEDVDAADILKYFPAY